MDRAISKGRTARSRRKASEIRVHPRGEGFVPHCSEVQAPRGHAAGVLPYARRPARARVREEAELCATIRDVLKDSKDSGEAYGSARARRAAQSRLRDWQASRPNERWVTDITSVWTDEGSRTSPSSSTCSRAVAGWALDATLATSPPLAARGRGTSFAPPSFSTSRSSTTVVGHTHRSTTSARCCRSAVFICSGLAACPRDRGGTPRMRFGRAWPRGAASSTFVEEPRRGARGSTPTVITA